jgi:hypothetical protein
MRHAAARLLRRTRAPRRRDVTDARALFAQQRYHVWDRPSDARRALRRLGAPLHEITCGDTTDGWQLAVVISMCFSGDLTMLRLSARLDARGLSGGASDCWGNHGPHVSCAWFGRDANIYWWTRFAAPRRLARYVVARGTGEGFGDARAFAAQLAAHLEVRRRSVPQSRALLDVFRRLARPGHDLKRRESAR